MALARPLPAACLTLTLLLCQARTDPHFRVVQRQLGIQCFSNPILGPPTGLHDDEQAREAASEMPTSSSLVSCTDGYQPSAMLFVDEELANMREAREGKLGQLLWKPVVRFCSTHYHYIIDETGPRIVQVGVGAEENAHGLNFGQPPPPTDAAAEARRGGCSK